MGFHQNQNQNQNLSSTLPQVTHWESNSQPSSVTNTVLVLGLMTFALQLCLLLFISHRLWRVNRKILMGLERPAPGEKALLPPQVSVHVGEESRLPCVTSRACEEDVTHPHPHPHPHPHGLSPFGPFTHWDLVQ